MDRFTAAPTNGHLFAVETWNGGHSELLISYPYKKMNEQEEQILVACILDLHFGLMAVGGGAGVGNGIVKIDQILVDDIDKTSELLTNNLQL